MSLIVALGFLTALPLPRGGALRPEALARSLGFFPVAGAIIGGLLLALDLALGLVLPVGVRSVLLLVALIAITRGLHFDGLMDVCDGLFGGFTPERRLEIMRDSRVGAFGVLGAAADLLLRYAALSSLADGWRVVEVDVVDRERQHGRSHYGTLDRLAVGIPDLFGVLWLIRRRRKSPFRREDEKGRPSGQPPM